MNNINIEGSNIGDKFKTRNGNIVELVYNTFDLEENKHKYLMYLSQSFPMSWFVYADGKIDTNKNGNWDIVEKVEDIFATTLKKSSFTEQIEEQNEMYKEAMSKFLNQIGDISNERKLDRREHIAIALIQAHGKYDMLEQDINSIERAITQDGK